MKVAKEWVYEILWSCKILGTDPMKPLILLAIVGPVPKISRISTAAGSPKKLSALASLGLARYESRAPLARRLRALCASASQISVLNLWLD